MKLNQRENIRSLDLDTPYRVRARTTENAETGWLEFFNPATGQWHRFEHLTYFSIAGVQQMAIDTDRVLKGSHYVFMFGNTRSIHTRDVLKGSLMTFELRGNKVICKLNRMNALYEVPEWSKP